MDHLVMKATTTEVDTDQGTFTARVSGWSTDRGGDEIDPHAFDQSLADWRRSRKQLPLLFEHGEIAIGSLDPHTAVTDESGLVIDGEVDRDTRQGRQVWKQIRRGSVGFSIGFMTAKSEDLKGGGKRLMVIDLLEISATSVPMHAGTGVISWKSATATDIEDLRERSLAAAREALAGAAPRRSTSEEEWEVLRRAHLAEKEAKVAEQRRAEEEQARRRRMYDVVPTGPKETLIFNGFTYEALDPDAELATPEQIEEREERRREEEAQARSIEQARAKAAREEPPTVSVHGMEVARVRVNGEVLFGDQ